MSSSLASLLITTTMAPPGSRRTDPGTEEPRVSGPGSPVGASLATGGYAGLRPAKYQLPKKNCRIVGGILPDVSGSCKTRLTAGQASGLSNQGAGRTRTRARACWLRRTRDGTGERLGDPSDRGDVGEDPVRQVPERRRLRHRDHVVRPRDAVCGTDAADPADVADHVGQPTRRRLDQDVRLHVGPP